MISVRDNRAVALTEDHKPTNEGEKKRIEAAGHEVKRTTTIQNSFIFHYLTFFD